MKIWKSSDSFDTLFVFFLVEKVSLRKFEKYGIQLNFQLENIARIIPEHILPEAEISHTKKFIYWHVDKENHYKTRGDKMHNHRS